MPMMLLPNKKIYTAPSFEEINKKKQTFLKTKFGDAYYWLDPKENESKQENDRVLRQWDKIIAAFSSACPGSASQFNMFSKKQKEAAQNNQFVLSLKQGLNYFEYFYFMYFNDDPDCKLDANDKNGLLKGILDGISPNLCDPGKVTRFEELLQQYKNDTKSAWITNLLYKQRRMIIQQLADTYNIEKKVPGSMSVHTVALFNSYAEKAGLGINSLEKIRDIYLLLEGNEKYNYFSKKYPVEFTKYEKEIIDSLVEYARNEVVAALRKEQWYLIQKIKTEPVTPYDGKFNALYLHEEGLYFANKQTKQVTKIQTTAANNDVYESLKKRIDADTEFADAETLTLINQLIPNVKPAFDLNLWECDDIPLSNNHLAAMDKQLRDLFLGVNLDDMRSLLYKDNDGYCIPNKKDFTRALRQCISVKLEHDGFYSDLNTLDQNKTNPEVLENHGVSLKELFNFKNLTVSAENGKEFKALFSKNPKIGLYYPQFLAYAVAANPQLWFFLPKPLRNNTLLIRSLLKQLEDMIPACQSEDEIKQIVNQLWCVIKSNPDYLHYLGHDAWSNKTFTETLIAKEGMLILHAPSALKKDDALIKIASDQNPLVASHMGKYYATLQLNNAKNRLKAKGLVDVKVLFDEARHLSPKRLLEIVKERSVSKYPPLPLIDQVSLESFCSYVGDAFGNNYLATKEKFEQEILQHNDAQFMSRQYYEFIAKQHVAEANHWFIGYLSFQKQMPTLWKTFNSWEDIINQLKHSYYAFTSLCKSLLEFILIELGKIAVAYALFMASYAVSSVFWDIVVAVVLATYETLGHVMLPLHIGLFVMVLKCLGYGNSDVLKYLGYLFLAFHLLFDITLFLTPFIYGLEFFLVELQACFVALELSVLILASIGLLIYAFSLTWEQPLHLNEVLMIVMQGFSYYFFAENAILNIVIGAFKQFIEAFVLWVPMIGHSILPWLIRPMTTLFSSANQSNIPDVQQTIMELQNKDDGLSQQKADLLHELWAKIQKDRASSPEIPLSQALDKRYQVSQLSKTYSCSFNEIKAAISLDSFVCKSVEPPVFRSTCRSSFFADEEKKGSFYEYKDPQTINNTNSGLAA